MPDDLRWPMAATVGGNALDAATTWRAISDGRAREGNPMLPQNPAAIVGLKAATTIPELILLHVLAAHGHPTAAKILGYSIGALGTGLALHNRAVVGQPPGR